MLIFNLDKLLNLYGHQFYHLQNEVTGLNMISSYFQL